jgi:membrane protease YdiL (CAAX protease family)
LYHAFSLGAAAWVTATGAVTIYAVQGACVKVMSEIAASIVGDVVALAVVLAAARLAGMRLGDLGVRRPARRFVIAAALIGCTAWYLNLLLVVWLQPPGETKALERMVEQASLLPTVLGLGLLPALVEEVVFRGVLARSLAARFDPIIAVVASAAVFAVYHVLPIQMVPTFVLGLWLGILTVRSRSILPAMVTHFINNLIAIVVSREELPGVSSTIGAHPTAMALGSAAVLACGLLLCVKGAPA